MSSPQSSIFTRMKLGPAALRTVAERRFDDAVSLQRTGQNARANGAMYLAGFAIECLLKAELLETYPWLQNGGYPADRPETDRWLWSLCYRSHDLDEMLMHLPHVLERVQAKDQAHGPKPSVLLKQICARWTIHARYSSRSASIREASEFLDTIKEIKKCLH